MNFTTSLIDKCPVPKRKMKRKKSLVMNFITRDEFSLLAVPPKLYWQIPDHSTDYNGITGLFCSHSEVVFRCFRNKRLPACDLSLCILSHLTRLINVFSVSISPIITLENDLSMTGFLDIIVTVHISVDRKRSIESVNNNVSCVEQRGF